MILLVKGSAKLFSDFIYSTSTIPFSIYYFTNRYLVWICLVFLMDEFFVINIAPLLSTIIFTGKLILNPKNSRILITNTTSLHESYMCIYSASDDNWDTILFCFDLHTMGFPLNVIIHPEMLFLLTVSPPQSLST